MPPWSSTRTTPAPCTAGAWLAATSGGPPTRSRTSTGRCASTPGNLEALAARGAAHDNLGQYDRAIEDFSRVIVIDPDDSRVRFARGVARMRLGANEEAIEDFSAILKVNPDEIGALYARAVARQWLGRDDEANEHFERYFELAPDEADADSGGVIQLAADVQRDDWLDRQALLKLRAGGWEIDIERRVDFTQAMNHMEERRGYAVTHNCRLRRRGDGDEHQTFTFEEAEPALEAVHLFTSFVRGGMVGVALPVGYAGGAHVIEQWHLTPADPGRYPDPHRARPYPGWFLWHDGLGVGAARWLPPLFDQFAAKCLKFVGASSRAP